MENRKTGNSHKKKSGDHPHGSTHSQGENVSQSDVHTTTSPEDAKSYPCCNCPCPGPHSSDCMFYLYHQMIGNQQITKDLMAQYINQMTKDPKELEMERLLKEAKQEMYSKFCQQQEVDIPSLRADKHVQTRRPSMAIPNLNQFGGSYGQQGEPRGRKTQDCLQLLIGEGGVIGPESESRKLIEEQRRMKSLWMQFMNIFDMALELADEASNARWQMNCRRKEDERLACKRRMEEANQARHKQCLDEQASKEAQQPDSKRDTPKPSPKQSLASDKTVNAAESIKSQPKEEEIDQNGGEENTPETNPNEDQVEE